MVQEVKVLAANLDDLSSISRTHRMEEDSKLLQAVLWPPHMQ